MRRFCIWIEGLDRGWFWRFVFVVCLGAAVFGGEARVLAAEYQVFVGTYTGEESRGIYSFSLDASEEKIEAFRLAAEAENPSFLAVHPNRRFLYAVNEVNKFDGKASGAVDAYQIRRDGSLLFLNQAATGGGAPCHLVVEAAGSFLLVANYSGGSVSVFRLGGDGLIGERTEIVQHLGSSRHPRRQRRPHAHSVNLDVGNRYVAVADLGVDKVFVYPLDAAAGRLRLAKAGAVSLPPGFGPRHFAFHPRGKLAFVNGELSSSLASLQWDSAVGTLEPLDRKPTLPADFAGSNSTAEVQCHPNGRFVYVSNRGHDSIAVFGVDAATGRLTPIEREPTQGQTPRHFGISPCGDYLLAANQRSNSIVVFRIDSESGKLEAAGLKVEAPTPVCVQFLPTATAK